MLRRVVAMLLRGGGLGDDRHSFGWKTLMIPKPPNKDAKFG